MTSYKHFIFHFILSAFIFTKCNFDVCTLSLIQATMYYGSAVIYFFHAATCRPGVARQFQISQANQAFAYSQVCDNTLLGICVSRRNAVSAGKGRKALQLIED